jgi:nucleotide-binding universal stress UspA family protein
MATSEQKIANILVPVDYSATSKIALDYAVAIAKKFHAKVTVMHGFGLPADWVIADPRFHKDIEEIETENYAKLEEVIRPYKAVGYEDSADALVFEKLVVLGMWVEKIAEATEKGEYDLVVMGTKGVSGLDEVIFGSVAGQVAEAVHCPTLAVPAEAEFKGIKHILYATNFDERDIVVIDELLEFAHSFDADIVCLHVNTDKDKLAKDLNQLTSLEEQFWFTPFSKLQFELVQGQSVEKGIDRYIHENQPNIIAVLPQERSFLENLFHSSISRKMAYHSKLPVLILKSKLKNMKVK